MSDREQLLICAAEKALRYLDKQIHRVPNGQHDDLLISRALYAALVAYDRKPELIESRRRSPDAA